MLVEENEPITIGVEIECYTILTSKKRISRSVLLPREDPSEKGERFTVDKSIGSEYVTKPFKSVVEALYAIDRGLGKYAEPSNNHNALPLPIGGWNDRFAGAHFHIGFKEKGFRKEEALSLANYIHDHIPFIIAISANSPVWRRRITKYSSNRILRGGGEYCMPVVKGELNQNHYREINFNPENKHKPSTFEIRVCDSNIPPYVCTVMAVLMILVSAWRNGKKACNSLTHEAYLQSRIEAARKGVKSTLYWDREPVTVGEYLRLLTFSYKDETSVLDLPRDVLEVFSLLEKGWNHAEVIRHAAIESRRKYGRGWEKNMAVKLASAMETLLNGGSLKAYHKSLGLESLPD
ncbi:MAG: glutamate-cysteine ligase family protein [Thermoproteota archaeon]